MEAHFTQLQYLVLVMSLASESGTSAHAIEGSLQQQLLRKDRKVQQRFGTHRASETRRLMAAMTLICADLVSTLAAFSLFDAVFALSWTVTTTAALLLLIGLFWVSGLYGSPGLTPPERMRRRLLVTIAFMTPNLLINGEVVQWNLWLAAGCQGALVFLLGHYCEILTRHFLIRNELWGAATAFAGCGAAIQQAHQLFSVIPALGVRPVRHIHHVDDLASLDDPEIEFVVVANQADLERVCKAAKFFACPPTVLLLEAETAPGRSFIGPGRISLAVGHDINAAHNRLMKRTIDLAVSIPATLIALPIIGVLAFLIKLFSPGPAFYRQVRVGLDNRALTVLKLRTMHCDAERLLHYHLRSNDAARLEWERFCKLSRDPRILPYIGNCIRRMSLDELPQLWQVVRGDISLIGPRPFPAYHTDLFDPEFKKLRSNVPGGLTGFWQVSSRNNGDIEAQKAQDLYYILNWSIWLDFYILLQTVPAVIGARGR